jgi:hypothetical protein
MNRKIKALGLALIATFAMSAFASASAQAQTPQLQAGAANWTLTGKQVEGGHSFTLPSGRQLTCETATFHGGPFANQAVSEATVFPTYEQCHTKPVLGIKFPATVTMEGCDYLFNDFAHNAVAGDYTANVDIICPPGKSIVVHLYKAGNTTHTENLCTIFVAPATNLAGNTVTNVAGSPDDLLLHHEVTVQTTGSGTFPCPGATPQNSVYRGTTTVSADDEAGNPTTLTAVTN